jgi:biofilm PGA synthesis protein PgaD
VSKHSKALIIESPGLQRPLPRNVWKLVTALFWAAWFWIWLPLLTVIGWAFGINTVFDQFVTRWGYIELLRLLPYYLLVIGVSGVSLVGWSLLQYHRFHGKERRKAFPLVTRAEIATGLGLAEETTAPWAAARRMVAYHDENGRVSWVEIGDVADAAAPPSATVVVLGSSIEHANRDAGENSNEAVLAAIEIAAAPIAPTLRRKTKRARAPVAPLIVERFDERDYIAVGELRVAAVGDYEPLLDSLASEDTISRFSANASSNGNAATGQMNGALGGEANESTSDFTTPVAVNAPSQSPPPRRKRRSLATAQARKRGHFSL